MAKKNAYLREYISGNRMYSLVFISGLLILGCIQEDISSMVPLDFFFLVFRGFSYRSFNITEFIYYLFYYIYPLFWINVFLEQEKKDKNMVAKFRYLSVGRWNQIVIRESLAYVLGYYCKYVCLALLVGVALAILHPGSAGDYAEMISQNYGISIKTVYIGLIIAMIWRLVELLILLLVDLLLFHFTDNTLAAFLGSFWVYLVGAAVAGWNIQIVGLAAAYSLFEIAAVDLQRLLMSLMASMILLMLLVKTIKLTVKTDR